MAGKKITRKQLLKEPDEFITTTGKVIRFFRENQKQMTLGGIILGAVLAAGILGYSYFHWEEGKALAVQQQGLQIYQEAFAGAGNQDKAKETFKKALEKFQEAYKINKHNVFLLLYMGIILTVRKNHYAAEKYFSEATKRDPNYDEAWFYAAENFFKAGNFKRALESYEMTKKLNPAYNNIAMHIKATRDALARKSRPGKKDSLLRRIVNYFRNAFEK